jgi:transcriptional regulator with XRE-family HTH domain
MSIDGTIKSEQPWDQELGILELVGQRIRFVREKSGKTAQELSQTTGLPSSHISAIERGKANPTVRTLDKIARGIGCSLRDLMPPR